MRFILDTNVVSELRKVQAGRADPNVATWASGIDAADMYLSAISVMELEIGVMRLENKDPHQGAIMRAWLDHHVMPEFSDRILSIDAVVAQRCARLHIPDPASDRDALIAATGLVHGLTIATRNIADFERTGVSLINPWR